MADSDIEDFNNTVAVLVGPEEQRFILHQDAVCDMSKFFKAACSKRWVEGQEKLVRLPEAKPEVFQEYCKWIYSGTIDVGRLTPQGEQKSRTAEHSMLINLFLLADSLDDRQLRKVATQEMSKCLDIFDTLPSPIKLETIWSSTLPGSLYRKMLVDYTVARTDRDSLAKIWATYPQEYTQEVAIAALRKATITTWKSLAGDGSAYLEPEEPKANTT
jgi:hypothetical protein